MRYEQPAQKICDQDETRQTKRTFAITAPEFYISQRQQCASNHHRDEDRKQQNQQRALPETGDRGLHVAWLVPRVTDLEVDRLALEGARLDVNLEIRLIGIRAFPRRTCSRFVWW